MSPKILAPHYLVICYLYCLGYYLVIKEVVESPFIVNIRILPYPESSAAVYIGHIYNSSGSIYVW